MLDIVLGTAVIGLGVFIGAVWLVYTHDILWARASPSSRKWLIGYLVVLALLIGYIAWSPNI